MGNNSGELNCATAINNTDTVAVSRRRKSSISVDCTGSPGSYSTINFESLKIKRMKRVVPVTKDKAIFCATDTCIVSGMTEGLSQDSFSSFELEYGNVGDEEEGSFSSFELGTSVLESTPVVEEEKQRDEVESMDQIGNADIGSLSSFEIDAVAVESTPVEDKEEKKDVLEDEEDSIVESTTVEGELQSEESTESELESISVKQETDEEEEELEEEEEEEEELEEEEESEEDSEMELDSKQDSGKGHLYFSITSSETDEPAATTPTKVLLKDTDRDSFIEKLSQLELAKNTLENGVRVRLKENEWSSVEKQKTKKTTKKKTTSLQKKVIPGLQTKSQRQAAFVKGYNPEPQPQRQARNYGMTNSKDMNMRYVFEFVNAVSLQQVVGEIKRLTGENARTTKRLERGGYFCRFRNQKRRNLVVEAMYAHSRFPLKPNRTFGVIVNGVSKNTSLGFPNTMRLDGNRLLIKCSTKAEAVRLSEDGIFYRNEHLHAKISLRKCKECGSAEHSSHFCTAKWREEVVDTTVDVEPVVTNAPARKVWNMGSSSKNPVGDRKIMVGASPEPEKEKERLYTKAEVSDLIVMVIKSLMDNGVIPVAPEDRLNSALNKALPAEETSEMDVDEEKELVTAVSDREEIAAPELVESKTFEKAIDRRLSTVSVLSPVEEGNEDDSSASSMEEDEDDAKSDGDEASVENNISSPHPVPITKNVPSATAEHILYQEYVKTRIFCCCGKPFNTVGNWFSHWRKKDHIGPKKITCGCSSFSLEGSDTLLARTTFRKHVSTCKVMHDGLKSQSL